MTEQVYPTRRSKRARIAAKSEHKCWYCGCKLSDATRTHDHVIPRSENGPSNEQNMVLACVTCNNQKRNLSLEDYRKECGGMNFFGESIQMIPDPEQNHHKVIDVDDKELYQNEESRRVQLPTDNRRPKYVNDPRRAAPLSGRGQSPK